MIRVEEKSKKYDYYIETIPIDKEVAEKTLNRLAESGWRLVTAIPTAVRESTIAPEPRLIPSLYCIFERYSSGRQNSSCPLPPLPSDSPADATRIPPSRPLAVFN